MTASPEDTPLTTPLASTVATAGEPLCHDTGRPNSKFPARSLRVAWRGVVASTMTCEADGDTSTRATAAGDVVVRPQPVTARGIARVARRRIFGAS